MISAYKPQTQWMMNSALTQSMKEGFPRESLEEPIQVPRNFGLVPPVNSMWRDQDKDEKEGQQPYEGNSLDFYHNKREEEKRMNGETE